MKEGIFVSSNLLDSAVGRLKGVKDYLTSKLADYPITMDRM
jgi:hypothetical protein